MKHVVDCKCPKFRAQMFRGEFGLEKETLRVISDGTLAKTSHPFTKEEFGRDFAECQLEMVTPVCGSTRELHETMTEMVQDAQKLLGRQNPPEYLWPCSNPAIVNSDIPIASFEGEWSWKSEYREHLAKVYGKEKMLYSGIHYNFSFPQNLIAPECREEIYLNLASHLYANAYIPVLLMAASPVYDASFFGGEAGKTVISPYASMRCGKAGYWNDEKLYLDFTSTKAYVDSVHEHIEAGHVQLASELYLPVRLKSSGDHSVEGLLEKGIAYVEYRMLDLNPLEPTGIDYRDLEFLHLLMIYLTFLPEICFGEQEQSLAIDRVQSAALLVPPRELVAQAIALIEDMKKFYQAEDVLVEPYLDYQLDKLYHPGKRYANVLVEKYKQDYISSVLRDISL